MVARREDAYHIAALDSDLNQDQGLQIHLQHHHDMTVGYPVCHMIRFATLLIFW